MTTGRINQISDLPTFQPTDQRRASLKLKRLCQSRPSSSQRQQQQQQPLGHHPRLPLLRSWSCGLGKPSEPECVMNMMKIIFARLSLQPSILCTGSAWRRVLTTTEPCSRRSKKNFSSEPRRTRAPSDSSPVHKPPVCHVFLSASFPTAATRTPRANKATFALLCRHTRQCSAD